MTVIEEKTRSGLLAKKEEALYRAVLLQGEDGCRFLMESAMGKAITNELKNPDYPRQILLTGEYGQKLQDLLNVPEDVVDVPS